MGKYSTKQAVIAANLWNVFTRLAEWCASYPRTKFRFVPGNHDLFAEQQGLLSEVRLPKNAKLLIDESYEVRYEPFVFDL